MGKTAPKQGHQSGPRTVNALLRSKRSQLGKLLAQAREVERLDRVLSGFLEPSMAQYVQVAARRGHCLVLATPSAAIATRLRLDHEHLLKNLDAVGEKSIREIMVRIAPIKRNTEILRKRRELPAIAVRSLERFAADSGDDEVKAIVGRNNPPVTGE